MTSPDDVGDPHVPATRSAAVRWAMLACAIGSEVAASLSLKGALDHPALYVVVAVGFVSAFVFLSLVLRAGMALGVAYGIWGATGVAATALLSAVIYGETLTLTMVAGLVLIIGGVLMVEVGSQRATSPATAGGPNR